MEALEMTIIDKLESIPDHPTEFIEQVMDGIDAGIIDPLKFHVKLKGMEVLIDSLTNTDAKKNKYAAFAFEYRKQLIAAAETYGQKSFDAFSAKIEIKEVGTKYDWSQCNDNELSILEHRAKEAADKLKARQEFLKILPVEGLELTDKVTGEIFTIYRPSKSSTTAVAVTIK